MKAASGRIRRFHYWSKAMTLEQEQALKAHLKAIAQILYDDSDPEEIDLLRESGRAVKLEVDNGSDQIEA
jgi:hypothetical protein